MTRIACPAPDFHEFALLKHCLSSNATFSDCISPRESLQRWAVSTSAQKDPSSDERGNAVDALPATQVVLPITLAELRQR